MLHVRQLDGIRAIAVLIVVLAHAGLERIVPGGFGVTIFFFLSGYLITTLMRAEIGQTGSLSIRNFYIRRVCRINPPLWITLLAAATLAGAGLIRCRIEPHAVLAQLLFTANYLAPQDRNAGIPVTSLWSLAVEEHFYLLFPLLYLRVLSRLPARTAAAWLLGACLAVLAIRCGNVLLLADFSGNYRWTHTRVDSILFGCCLAVWQNPLLDKPTCYRPKTAHIAAACGVLVICLAVRNEVFRQTIRYTLQGGALFVLFSAALQNTGRLRRLLSSSPLRLVGVLSYTIYLWHETAFTFLDQNGRKLPPLCRALLAVGLIGGYAGLVYWLVEQPFAAIRRRLHRHGTAKSIHAVMVGRQARPAI
jgi:peptidoglycan/LPS O-acetylase OafA/YrhL